MVKRNRFSKKKEKRRRIAMERIDVLMRLSEQEAVGGNHARADRYGQLATRIGMRYNISLPGEFKHKFCRKCGTFRVAPHNSRTRLTGQYITVHCLKCNDVYRRPYKRPRPQKGKE